MSVQSIQYRFVANGFKYKLQFFSLPLHQAYVSKIKAKRENLPPKSIDEKTATKERRGEGKNENLNPKCDFMLHSNISLETACRQYVQARKKSYKSARCIEECNLCSFKTTLELQLTKLSHHQAQEHDIIISFTALKIFRL